MSDDLFAYAITVSRITNIRNHAGKKVITLNLQVQHALHATHTTQTECEERNTHLSNSASDMLTFPSSCIQKLHKKLLIVSKMETQPLTPINEAEKM